MLEVEFEICWIGCARFLDDYFLIFNGTTKDLHRLLEEINLVHPTIKLTLNHTTVPGEDSIDICDCKEEASLPFLLLVVL